jgi:hypothetical protein
MVNFKRDGERIIPYPTGARTPFPDGESVPTVEQPELFPEVAEQVTEISTPNPVDAARAALEAARPKGYVPPPEDPLTHTIKRRQKNLYNQKDK